MLPFSHRRRLIEHVVSEMEYCSDAVTEIDVLIDEARRIDNVDCGLLEKLYDLRDVRVSDLMNERARFRRQVKRSRHLDFFITGEASRAEKLAALDHPKITCEQVTSLVDDEDMTVREAARAHKKSWFNVRHKQSVYATLQS